MARPMIMRLLSQFHSSGILVANIFAERVVEFFNEFGEIFLFAVTSIVQSVVDDWIKFRCLEVAPPSWTEFRIFK